MTSRRSLPWIPILILLATAGSLVWIDLRAELERNLKGWLMTIVPLLATVLLTLWFLLSPRFSGKTRLLGLIALIIAGVAAKQLVRVDGVIDGRGLPRLVWRWSAASKPAVAPLIINDDEAPLPLPKDPRLAEAANVPQFFGPNRDGIAPAVKLSTDWTSSPPKQLWRQPIGAGWSAFAVVDGRAITQEQRGEDETVTCYELFTGRILWATMNKAHFTEWQGGDGPRSTPTVHEGRVYTLGGTGILSCLDLITGKLFWQNPLLETYKLANITWGISSSPLIVDDKVVVSSGRADKAQPPLLIAFNLADGKEAWRSGEGEASYSSPMLATLAGRRVILYQGARSLTAHDTATGSVLMEHPWGNEKWPRASQPVVIAPDRVFLSAGYGMGCCMLQVKAEPDGKLTATELWASLKMKTQFNSTALFDNHLFGLDDGRLTCLDISTGERLWKEGRYASGQSLLVGDLVIVQNESGPIHLCAASAAGYKEFAKLDALSRKTWNHPVLAGRYLLVRNDVEAACYELPVK